MDSCYPLKPYIYVFTHISVDLRIRLDCIPEVLARRDFELDNNC